MDKYKICPSCGTHNNPLAIECDECGEDLSAVRIVDDTTINQLNSNATEDDKNKSDDIAATVKKIRICEECGEKNDVQLRKCRKCGDDISMIIPVDDIIEAEKFIFASLDGEYSFLIPDNKIPVVIGREAEMKEYLNAKMYVSRRHAELFVEDKIIKIKSYSTAVNGTHVNGKAIKSDEFIELSDGDVVGLGGNDENEQPEAAYFRVRIK